MLAADVGTCAVEEHRVQVRWFQNAFIFCSRPFSAELPQSVIDYRAGTEDSSAPAHALPVTAEQRLLWAAQRLRERKALKTERRATRRLLVMCAGPGAESSGATGRAEPDSEVPAGVKCRGE